MCNTKKKIILFVFVILNLIQNLFFSLSVQALVVGSDTVVSRQTSLVTFPVAAYNELLGFTAVNAGLTLTSATTTCTFNTLMPISGDVTFNNGYVFLNKDVLLANPFRFMNGGRFRGNSKTVKIAESTSDSTVPVSSGVLVLDGTTLELNSNVILGGLWRIRGLCKIIGNGRKLSLGAGNFVIELGDKAQLALQNVYLAGVGNSNLRCITDNASISFSDTVLHLASDFTFSRGALTFDKDVLVSGTSKFNYTSSQVSTIASGSILFLDNGITFNYAPTIASKNLLVMSDVSSGLYLNGSILSCTTTGLRLSTGTLYLDNYVTVSSQAQNSGQAMELDSSLNIQALAGAVLDLFGIIKYV